MNRQTRIILPMALLVLLSSTGVTLQARADSDMTGFTRFTGKVTQVDGNSFIVSTRRVDLIDVMYQGKRYQTKILDMEGKPMKSSDIRKGDLVLIWGQEQRGGAILASTVHLQTRE